MGQWRGSYARNIDAVQRGNYNIAQNMLILCAADGSSAQSDENEVLL